MVESARRPYTRHVDVYEPIDLHAYPLSAQPSPEWLRLLREFRAEIDGNRDLMLDVYLGLPLAAALVMALKLALQNRDIRGESRKALETLNAFLISQLRCRGLKATCAIAESGKVF